MQSGGKHPRTTARAIPWSIPWSFRLGILLACVAAPTLAEDFEESVPASPGETVEVEIDFGDGLRPDPGFVQLSSYKGDEVRARVDTTGWGSWDVEVTLERRAGRVRLDVRARGTTTWMFGGPNIRIDVSVPEDVNVDVVSWGGNVRIEDLVGGVRATLHDADIRVRGVDGRVKLNLEDSASAEVEEVRGDFEASADSGSIRAGWIQGRAEVRAGNGSVVLERVDGPITVKSLDGDIELNEVVGPVAARSDRGSVTIGFSDEPGGIVETELGDVAVTLPEKSGAALDARTGDGTVDVATGEWSGERGPKHARGTIGAGGPRLVVRSARGGIRVSQR